CPPRPAGAHDPRLRGRQAGRRPFEPDPVSTGVGRTVVARTHPSRALSVLIAALALLVAACADPGGGAPGAASPSTVRLALDWTPNTNHTGLYVAQQQGWFAEAGLDVQILPYNQTSPDTLVSSGAADFGISF